MLIWVVLVPCAVGSFYSQENKTCTPCPQGTYQSETGQLQCTKCPNIAGRPGVTAGTGARSAADCKGKFMMWECKKRICKNSCFKQNVVLLENISTPKMVCVVRVAMGSSNPKKVHLRVSFAVWVKRLDLLKPNLVANVVTNVSPACNWEPMPNVSHVLVARTALKVFNLHVKPVLWDEQHQR